MGMLMTCGIYQLTSPSGKRYIGSSKCIEKRWNMHFWRLKNGRHANQHMQNVFNSHGLTPSILLICAEHDLLFYEQLCLDGLKPELNASSIANCPELTDEVRQKLSTSMAERWSRGELQPNKPWLNKKFSDEHRAKLSEAAIARGGRPNSEESKAKVSASKKGKPWSEARRAAHDSAKMF